MKTKRIKAHHYYSVRLLGICYVVKQSDVRALAEQFVADANKEADNPRSKVYDRVGMQLHVMKRAGITPGRKGAK